MKMKLASHHREVADELNRHGIKPEIEPTRGGHVRYGWIANGHTQCVTLAKTPSDWRGVKNNVARVRRLLRTAGVIAETTPKPPAAPRPAAPPLRPDDQRIAWLEARVAELERDVRKLLDWMVEPPGADLIPAEPIVKVVEAPIPKCGRRRRDLSWLWCAMRYDEFLSAAAIAKETRRRDGYISVLLTGLKKLGLVDHKPRIGWRKHHSLEGKNRTYLNGHASAH